MYHNLLSHIAKYVALTAEEQQLLMRFFKYQTVNKKSYLLTEGDVCHASYFILKGCFRMYFIKDNGTEKIVQFGIDNWWITDYMSMDLRQPSKFFIQALEDSEVAVFDRSVQEELFDRLPKLERYFRLILQRAQGAFVNRLFFLNSQSGEERYHYFNSAFPEFVQRVPQYMLASYLGFTPEFLSKIRAKNT
jgi:CRP/FNR family transcriptional regulator